MEITVNGNTRTVPEGTTVAQLLEELGLAGRYVAVEVNRELVPRKQHEGHTLSPGDRVEIVTLVGGG